MKHLLPESVRAHIRTLRRAFRRSQVRRRTQTTRAQLADAVRGLGVHDGDVVFLHSSLSAIGFVVGGPDSVIDAFLDVLGERGTLAMPSFPFDTYVEDYLARTPSFDVAETPSRMGKITEMFRQRPGVRRSVHATHPVVAWGPHSETLVADHHRDLRTFGPLSPFHRMCELGARIVLVGVDYHSMTHLHVVEDIDENFPYNVYRPELFRVQVHDVDGLTRDIDFRAHTKQLSSLRDCNKMERYFDEAGILRRGHVGEAPTHVLDARGVLDTMTRLASCGITMYADDAVPDALRKSSRRPN